MVNFQDALAQLGQIIVRSIDEDKNIVVLIDGHAGSGKTKFATELQELVFSKEQIAPRLLHMDDLYEGWDGLRAGSTYLNQQILKPRSTGRIANWQIWDWDQSKRGSQTEPGNGWRSFEGRVPLLVEGCGSISKVARDIADFAVWIDSPERVRQTRLRERDGSKFDEFWPTWAMQEAEFYKTEKSRDLADLVVTN